MAMTGLFLARVLLELLLSIAVHARIEISPTIPVVEVGSKVNLSCRILEDSKHHTAHDLVWYHNSRILPRSNYSSINISVVTLGDVGFADSGVYSCCLPLEHKCNGTRLAVGVPPGPVSEFRCIGRNIYEYWCEWQPGVDTHLEDTYQFYFKKMLNGGPNWQECPDYLTKGVNSCFVSVINNHGVEQLMKLVTTNQLGSYDEDHVSFWPETQTIPNPPSNVVVFVEDDERIMVRWNIPDDWTEYDALGGMLEYKLRFKPNTAVTWTEVQRSSLRSYSLSNLKPFTMYCVQVAAIILNPDNYKDYWSDWSEMEYATTKEAVPTAPLNITITGTTATSISLSWTPPLEPNGVIQHYILEYFSSNHPKNKTYIEGRSYTVSGLNGYEIYTLRVQACTTHVPCGPLSEPVTTMTNTGVPEKPYLHELHVLSSSKIRMSWNLPQQCNGPVQYYMIQHRQSSKPSLTNWEKTKVEAARTTHDVHVGCGKNEEGVMYDFQVSAINIDSNGYILKGHAMMRQHEMCQKVPVPVNIPVVIIFIISIIPIHVVGIILYAIYSYTVKKLKDFPEPRFIVDLDKLQKDLRNDRPFVAEKETFDSLCEGCDKNVQINRTRSESTDSGVPSSPDHTTSDVIDQLTQDSSLLPSHILATNDDSCHNFTLGRSEDSIITISDEMENSGASSFCNSIYMQETFLTDRFDSISCDLNNNTHTVNTAEALIVQESNAQDGSVNLLNQKEVSTQNTNMVEQLQVAEIHADNPYTPRDKIPFIRVGQSADNIENAPYFQIGFSTEPSLPPAISHNSDRKQLPYFKLDQLASIRELNDQSEQSQVDCSANICMNFAMSKDNSNQGVKMTPTVSNNAQTSHNKTDSSAESYSQMADLAANQLQPEQQTKEPTKTNPAAAKHSISDSSKSNQYLGYVHVDKSGKISIVDGHSVGIQPNLN